MVQVAVLEWPVLRSNKHSLELLRIDVAAIAGSYKWAPASAYLRTYLELIERSVNHIDRASQHIDAT